MVQGITVLSRRRLLAAGAVSAGSVAGAYRLAASLTTGRPDLGGWPMARHDPGGTCHAPAARPPTDDVTVRWQRSIGSEYHQEGTMVPIAGDGRVLAVADDLAVIDARTGRIEQRVPCESMSPPALSATRPYASPTVVLNTDRGTRGVSPDGGVTVFGRHVGSRRWQTGRRAGDSTIGGRQTSPHPPVVAGETLVAGTPSGIAALEADTGALRWHREGRTRRPAVRDGVVYTTGLSNRLLAYDLASGERVIDVEFSALTPLSVTAAPDHLVLRHDEGLAGLSEDGTVQWRYEPDRTWIGTGGGVALANGAAYAGFPADSHSILVAVDAVGGTERWRASASVDIGPWQPTPSVADGVVYVAAWPDKLVALDAADGHERWAYRKAHTGSSAWSSVAIDGETLYATHGGTVYALEEP